MPEGEETIKRLKANLQQLKPPLLAKSNYDALLVEVDRTEQDSTGMKEKADETKYNDKHVSSDIYFLFIYTIER